MLQLRMLGALLSTALACGGAFAQVTYERLSQAGGGDAGDRVLNAPYRGTVSSLREATADIPFGEVRTHVEPITNSSIEPTPNMTIWLSAEAGFEQAWDRSVLRLYRGLDASGIEIDLTDTDENNPFNLGAPASTERFSLRAIGTKTLAPVKFRLKFRYRLQGAGSATTFTRDFTVAPMTATNAGIAGEADAFQFGVPLLDVQCGGARLTIPTGRTVITAGAALVTRQRSSTAQVPRFDVALPAAGETVFVAHANQFALNQAPFAKTAYGTPFPGYLRGYLATTSPNVIRGPDGTIYEYLDDLFDWPDVFKVTRIQPLQLGPTHPATQMYEWEEILLPDNQTFADVVTSIRDQASPTPNQITLTRNAAGFLIGVTTSDGRSWTIQSEPVYGRITGIIPAGGQGARYFKYFSSSPSGDFINRYRVTQVRLGAGDGGEPDDPTVGQDVMYAFIFGADGQPRAGDLLEERRFVDGALRLVVEHGESSPSARFLREFTGDVPAVRRTDFIYDTTTTPPLAHRLKSVTSYSGSDGSGAAFSTQYAHDVGAPTDPPASAGTMALTRVDLPDGAFITYEYDKSLPATHNLGLRLKSTRSASGGSPSLVMYDVDYEYFYTGGSPSVQRLFHWPRIVKQRDGRGAISEVAFGYEAGGADEPSPDGTPADGLTGEFSNQLRTRSGPQITLGTSGTRTPLVRYSYNQTNRMLKTVETRFGSAVAAFRRVDYEYDSLLRLRRTIIDPSGIAATTEYQYRDDLATQDRIVIDPDNYYAKTTFDNDGRPRFVQRFLTPGGATGNFYQTESVYNINGRLFQLKMDNKDQDGNAITAPVVTEHTYDRLGRLTERVLDPGGIGQRTSYDYNWLGDIEREFDTSGRGVSRTFDGRGLVDLETPLALGQVPGTNLTVTFDYDANGRLEFTNSPAGAVLQTVYDDFGRVTQQIRRPGPDGGVNIATLTEYDAASHVTRRTVRDNFTIGNPNSGVVLADTTALFDEGGFNYESRQRLGAGVDGANDPVTRRMFDWAGNVTEERSLGDDTVADRVVAMVYDDANRLEQVTDSEGGETLYVRDGRGNVTEQTVRIDGSNSAVTTTLFDALSRPIRVTDPEDAFSLRHYRERRYDSRGNLLRETRFSSTGTARTTSVFQYDAASRQVESAVLADATGFTDPVTMTDPTTDRVVAYEYDADSRLEFRTTFNNNAATPLVSETTYDDLGRVDTVTDPSGSFTDNNYATNGRLSSRIVHDGLSARTFTFAYDGHDRTTTHTAVGTPSLVTTFEYDGLDRQIRVIDPKGIVTFTDFDLIGRRVALIENEGGGALERQTDFGYNRLSQFTTQVARNNASDGTPLASQISRYRYDTLGRTLRIFYPDTTDVDFEAPVCSDCVRMVYDDAGRMTDRVDQRGWQTVFEYDDRGLLLTRTTAAIDRLDAFSFDPVGRMTAAVRGTLADPDLFAGTSLGYTDLGDLDFEQQAIAQGTARFVDYEHDQTGNRLFLEYPGGATLTYAPTALNQVASIGFAGESIAYSYHGGGQLPQLRATTTTSPNTSYRLQWNYDSHRRVSHVQNSLATGQLTQPLANYAFTHDNNGNPLTQTATGAPLFASDDRVFTVDNLDRLVTTDYAEFGVPETATFDLLGNRESFAARDGGTTNYGPVSTANEYATIDGLSVQYDAAGNLTVDEDGRQYFYDEQNRLTELRDAGNVVLAAYTYDALGRRVTATIGGVTTRHYYDGRREIEERDAADVRLAYHVNGGQYIDERVATWRDALGQFRYYLHGDNFSVVGVGGPAGGVQRVRSGTQGDLPCPPGPPPCNNCDHSPTCDGDVDGDGCVDFDDLSDLIGAYGTMLGDPGYNGCADFDCDGDVDFDDYTALLGNYGQCCPPCVPAPAAPFVLHGRPVDVLPDGKVLMYVRARFYDPENGRWLQRDPAGYVDGGNLYESFSSNAAAFVDPSGLWLARRIAEIVAENGQLTVGDIQRLGQELNSNVRNQVSDLTDEEIALLAAIGGPAYGTPFEAASLPAELRADADERWFGIASPMQRYRAESNYRTRRRMLFILLFQNQAFSQYVTDLYRVSRDLNPLHFAAERGIQVGTGREAITGQEVSRVRAGAEFVVYLALIKGAQVAPGAITRAAGGEVPGASITVAPSSTSGRVRVYRVEGTPNARIAIDEHGAVAIADDTKVLFLNFGNRARAEQFFAQKLEQGLSGAQIKSFDVPQQFLNELRASAVGEFKSTAAPGQPIRVDVTKAPDQFGLRPEQIKALQDAIIQGTGKIEP